VRRAALPWAIETSSFSTSLTAKTQQLPPPFELGTKVTK